jgi:riboflavin synthase
MFTGIVEEAGTIAQLARRNGSVRMVVEAKHSADEVRIGDSMAVNGCCLTIVEIRRGRSGARLGFDLLEETWQKTSFDQLQVGARVNLERALRLNDRLGGHFVTGHVDGTGRIVRCEWVGTDWVLEVQAPRSLTRYLLSKGSIAIDGVSLTVAEVRAGGIMRVWIIPHTRKVTNLGDRKVGDRVNLEADLLGKYVERLMAASPATAVARRRSSPSKARSGGRAS